MSKQPPVIISKKDGTIVGVEPARRYWANHPVHSGTLRRFYAVILEEQEKRDGQEQKEAA